jgi:hypothetical protein
MTDVQLALIVSAASAAVAVVSFVWTIGWSIWQHRQLYQPRLTVLAANALPVGPQGAGEWCVKVTVVNDGGVAITLTTVKFMVRSDPHRRGVFPTFWVHTEPHPLPLKLTPGDRWTGLTERREIHALLRENFGERSEFALWVVAIDAADRSYRTKFTLSGWK